MAHRMLGTRGSTLLVIGWGVFLGAFTFLAATDFALLKNAQWCGDADTHCLRDWIAALSGWAAAFAASVTVIFLYRQNEEQKRQTQFLLGDARPTIDAILHIKRRIHVIIRVVNWNRRPIIIRCLKILPDRGEIDVHTLKIWDRDVPSNNLSPRMIVADRIVPAIAMHGWKDRSQAPCEIRLDIGSPTDSAFAERNWTGSKVVIELIVAGEENEQLTLQCPVADAQRDGDLSIEDYGDGE